MNGLRKLHWDIEGDVRRCGRSVLCIGAEIVSLDATGCPDLQALVERAGRRYAASIGEEYIEDPFRRMREAPHQGGYPHITPEEWAAYDQAMADWQARRR